MITQNESQTIKEKEIDKKNRSKYNYITILVFIFIIGIFFFACSCFLLKDSFNTINDNKVFNKIEDMEDELAKVQKFFILSLMSGIALILLFIFYKINVDKQFRSEKKYKLFIALKVIFPSFVVIGTILILIYEMNYIEQNVDGTYQMSWTSYVISIPLFVFNILGSLGIMIAAISYVKEFQLTNKQEYAQNSNDINLQ